MFPPAAFERGYTGTMNLRTRLARLAISLVVALTLPGLAPYQAVAQSFTARPLPAVSAVSAVGTAGASAAAAIPVLGAPASPLSASALPSPPSSVLNAAPTAVVLAAPSAAAAASASAAKAASPVTLAVTARTSAATTPATESLETATSRVAASADADPSGAATRVPLDALFTGETARPAADLSVAAAATSDRAFLSRSAAADGPRWVFTAKTPKPEAPRTSLKRTLSVGFIAGVLGVVFTDVGVMLAGLLGWVPHGNYVPPMTGPDPTAVGAAVLVVAGSVMAPIAEEIIFRAGLQGGLAKITSKIHLGGFLLPALVTSLVFVAVHETADPVLFAIRFGFAAILSYVFKKEGMLSSMTAHGVFNGLQMLPILFATLNAPWLVLLMIPGAVYAMSRSLKTLKSQQPDIASGALAPKPFTVKHALMFLPVLAFGFLALMPNVYWLAGAVALGVYLLGKAIAAILRGILSLIR